VEVERAVPGWRATVVALGVSLSAAPLALSAASAAPVTTRPEIDVVHPAALHAPSVALAPVTEHPLDPRIVPARAVASATETIQLTVIGGALTLASDHASITLRPTSRRAWVGEVPPVRVVDARGTGEGWTVRWRVASVDVSGTDRHVPTSAVTLTPASPVVVDGESAGLTAGRATRARIARGSVLFMAAERAGGGTYEDAAMVSVELPASFAADAVVVNLAFDVT
jgi:hypothetical protein